MITGAENLPGSILAGAVGDALGAPVEFYMIDTIRRMFGPNGTTGYQEEYGGRGTITDDTQMTLFTMEGMIRFNLAVRTGQAPDNLFDPIQHAYQRWFHTQGATWEEARGRFDLPEPDGWLIKNRGLFSPRGPGKTVMASLSGFSRGKAMGSVANRLNNSKGCGAAMRAAPIALLGEDAFAYAVGTGALTHGHPSGYLSAGAHAHLVYLLLGGADLPDAIAATRQRLLAWDGHEEQVAAIDAAIELAARGRPTPEAIEEHLGGGWRGEEAVAIALCTALVAEDMEDGLLLAVNHTGDSDSTGSLCGNLLGAMQGVDAIPAHLLAELELRDVIEEITRDLLTEYGDSPPETDEWRVRYPPS
jgi:ADP-ribosylglycohydrolase